MHDPTKQDHECNCKRACHDHGMKKEEPTSCHWQHWQEQLACNAAHRGNVKQIKEASCHQLIQASVAAHGILPAKSVTLSIWTGA